MRGLGGLLAALLLVGCSGSAVKVIELPDLLTADGRVAVFRLEGSRPAHVTWQSSYRAPLFMPLPLSSVRAVDLSVGTTPAWQVTHLHNGENTAVEKLPEKMQVIAASWLVDIYNAEASYAVSKQVPVNALLFRGACSDVHCEYVFDEATVAEDLLSFRLTDAEVPELPHGWPRALSTFQVLVALSLEIEPAYPLTNDFETSPPLGVQIQFVAGRSTVYSARTDSAHPKGAR